METESGGMEAAFEAQRGHLRLVAYRMLGSLSEAEDACQEAWLRLQRHGGAGIANLAGWLTTVTARLCLDRLRTRESRREAPLGDDSVAPAPSPASDPEREVVLAESVGLALLVMLDRLSPAERVALVLHDVFGTAFEEIAAVLQVSPGAARQLASRARKRVRGQPESSPQEQPRAVVAAFLAALRAGDFPGLLAVLHPDVVVRLRDAQAGGPREIRGAETWARGAIAFAQPAHGVTLAQVDGAPGLIWAPLGRLRRALRFTVAEGRITEAEIIADPERLRQLTIL